MMNKIMVSGIFLINFSQDESGVKMFHEYKKVSPPL